MHTQGRSQESGEGLINGKNPGHTPCIWLRQVQEIRANAPGSLIYLDSEMNVFDA